MESPGPLQATMNKTGVWGHASYVVPAGLFFGDKRNFLFS